MVYDLVDEDLHGPSPNYGLSRSQARRRKKPGASRLLIGFILIPIIESLRWSTQDVRQLLPGKSNSESSYSQTPPHRVTDAKLRWSVGDLLLLIGMTIIALALVAASLSYIF